jgi:cell wall-associated NlpC family hydrolase
MHDPRIGRFFATDPLEGNYAFYSPYHFSSNSPILAKELEGLESSKIINETEKYIGTPYEYGGKNPRTDFIGYIKNNTESWELMKPQLLKLSRNGIYDLMNNYSVLKSTGKLDSKATNTFKYSQIYIYRQLSYASLGFSDLSNSGSSLGIDCSGLVRCGFSQDKELLMTTVPDGSSNQLRHFKKAMENNQAFVHKDPNLISEGDLIYKPGHVMISTGAVRKDEEGNVTEFQTIEAASTSKGVINKWRKWGNAYTVGHPYRSSDAVYPSNFVGPLPQGIKRENENAPQTRTKNNQITK